MSEGPPHLAYTIGKRDPYVEALREKAAEGVPLYKIGKSSGVYAEFVEVGYEGGCAFRSAADAHLYLKDRFDDSYSVFLMELRGSWESQVDVSQEAEQGYGLLLHNAAILGEVKRKAAIGDEVTFPHKGRLQSGLLDQINEASIVVRSVTSPGDVWFFKGKLEEL